jgi:hypothetical protein
MYTDYLPERATSTRGSIIGASGGNALAKTKAVAPSVIAAVVPKIPAAIFVWCFHFG